MIHSSFQAGTWLTTHINILLSPALDCVGDARQAALICWRSSANDLLALVANIVFRTMTSSKPKILLLGGYGNTGRALAPLLLRHTTADIVIAGRNLSKAEEFAKMLEPRDRVSTVRVDASDSDSLRQAFSSDGVTLVVVLSTTSDFIDKIAGAALEAKIDYIDIHLCSTRKNEILGGLCDRIVESGLCFITDGGFHPGLPAAMVRYLAPTFTKLESARVGSVIQGDWKSCQQYMSANATDELASEISNMQTTLYKDGKWQNAGLVAMLNPPCMDFGAPFGKRPVIPMHLDEMRCLPVLYPSVKTVGFYVSGFNWAVDYLISPIAIASIMLFPSSKHIMGRFLNWGLTTFSKPPFGTWLKLEATGNDEKGARVEKSLILSHDGAYDLTAIPVAATVMQYLSPDYSVRKPGLWRQAEAVEPRQFFLDMQVMGVQIEPRVS